MAYDTFLDVPLDTNIGGQTFDNGANVWATGVGCYLVGDGSGAVKPNNSQQAIFGNFNRLDGQNGVRVFFTVAPGRAASTTVLGIYLNGNGTLTTTAPTSAAYIQVGYNNTMIFRGVAENVNTTASVTIADNTQYCLEVVKTNNASNLEYKATVYAASDNVAGSQLQSVTITLNAVLPDTQKRVAINCTTTVQSLVRIQRVESVPLNPVSAPTGTITSQPAPSGQSQRFVGTTTNADYGTYTLTGSDGGTTVSNQTFTVTSNAFDFTVTGLTPGTYVPTLTVTGTGGTAGVSGTSTFAIAGVSGGGNLQTPSSDTTSPVMAGSLSSSNITPTGFMLTWQTASDNVAVAGYQTSIDGGTTWVNVGNVLTRTFSSLQSNTSYATRVRAYDNASPPNYSAPLSLTVITSAAPDTEAPVLAGPITFSSITRTGFTMSWPIGTDNVALAGTEVSLDGGATWLEIGDAPSYVVANASAGMSYAVRVRVYDTSGNYSNELSGTVTTLPPLDLEPPGAPVGLVFASVAETEATILWSAASDNVGVVGYNVSIDGGQTYEDVGLIHSHVLQGLVGATTYQVRVTAYDASGNISLPLAGSFTTSAPSSIVYQLTSGTPTVVNFLSSKMRVAVSITFSDAPAPKSRTIVLTDQNRGIRS